LHGRGRPICFQGDQRKARKERKEVSKAQRRPASKGGRGGKLDFQPKNGYPGGGIIASREREIAQRVVRVNEKSQAWKLREGKYR